MVVSSLRSVKSGLQQNSRIAKVHEKTESVVQSRTISEERRIDREQIVRAPDSTGMLVLLWESHKYFRLNSGLNKR